jgi:hypothetical protein
MLGALGDKSGLPTGLRLKASALPPLHIEAHKIAQDLSGRPVLGFRRGRERRFLLRVDTDEWRLPPAVVRKIAA